LENGYAYLVDAFTHDAVRSMHVLHGDALGVAAQVLISNMTVLDGIAREVSAHARTLMNNFWPGMLSFMLRPHQGLSWDLGDGKRLDQICVRVPNAEFVLALLRKSGPLAVVSAADSGKAPILDASLISTSAPILAGIFDGGELVSSIRSTIVSDTETPPTLVRDGAVSLEALREYVPDMEYESSGN
ncbi:MAG: Sua5/YciO/YrdC/YwlC family protein, partial [Actinobacteria bacterium]|nr:Sua5/YciO/YrdC/YwlC family protein [Actinomycetota bacterium]